MALPILTEFFPHIPKYEAPKEGEPVIDPKKKLEPACFAKCTNQVNDYQSCVKRLRSRIDGKGNCLPQYEDLGACVDHCVAHDLFRYVK